MSERLPLIAGNWKMYKTLEEARALAREVRQGVGGRARPEVVLGPCPTRTMPRPSPTGFLRPSK